MNVNYPIQIDLEKYEKIQVWSFSPVHLKAFQNVKKHVYSHTSEQRPAKGKSNYGLFLQVTFIQRLICSLK